MTIPVTDRDLRRAERWLRTHGPGLAPTPLLAARLAARRQAMIGLAVVVIPAALVLAAERGWALVTSWPTSATPATPGLTGFVVAILVTLMLRVLTMRWVAHTERRFGATLTTRAAHAHRAGWRAIIGTRRLWMTVLVYSGTAAVGVAALASGRSPGATTVALVLLAAIAVLLVLMCVEIADIMRRPALAEDEESLKVDDVLRAADIQASTTPLLPVVLASLTVNQSGGQYPAWLLLCMVVLCTLALVEIVWSAATQRPTASPGATPTVHA